MGRGICFVLFPFFGFYIFQKRGFLYFSVGEGKYRRQVLFFSFHLIFIRFKRLFFLGIFILGKTLARGFPPYPVGDLKKKAENLVILGPPKKNKFTFCKGGIG